MLVGGQYKLMFRFWILRDHRPNRLQTGINGKRWLPRLWVFKSGVTSELDNYKDG